MIKLMGKKIFTSLRLKNFDYLNLCVLGAQKKHLIEMVLLSTHYIEDLT